MAENSAERRGTARDENVRPHVLLVTADADLRDFLQQGLLYGGFWLSVIASGVQTLEVFRLRTFDLVLIDSALPGLDATELIRRLRRSDSDEQGGRPRTDLPILLIVDHLSEEVEQRALESGSDAVLAPPLDLESLLPLLFQTVGDWRARHPDRPWADQLAQARPGDARADRNSG